MSVIAIYHLEAKVISRGEGRSAVAAAAYMSCDKIYNDYDGITRDYTKKQGLVWEQVFLPSNAPKEWANRSVLWNAVEESEKTKDSRLAREFVVALPIELKKDEWISLLSEFIRDNFVADGMCADVAIHDTDGHNPHAHIMLTVRPLDEKGIWQNKTEKEYLCVKDGEERGFTAPEFKLAQEDGWEKQYQYKVGKKKVYMPTSIAEAQGYERISKYPKSTRYGRQNPITARWNSEEQLVLWREAWAGITNQYLERAGQEERIDHRSHAERGIDEQPTIHEGVTARALEKKGIISDRCNLNRLIRADNSLLRKLKATVQRLMQAISFSVPKVAEAMETIREDIIYLSYQLDVIRSGQKSFKDFLLKAKPKIEKFDEIEKNISETVKEQKELITEKQNTPFWNILKHKSLNNRIAELTELFEKLCSKNEEALKSLQCADKNGVSEIREKIVQNETELERYNGLEERDSAKLNDDLTEYARLKEKSEDFDSEELYSARQVIRPEKENSVERKLQKTYGDRYDPARMFRSKMEASLLLNEETEERSIREKLWQRKNEIEAQQNTEQQNVKKKKRGIGR